MLSIVAMQTIGWLGRCWRSTYVPEWVICNRDLLLKTKIKKENKSSNANTHSLYLTETLLYKSFSAEITRIHEEILENINEYYLDELMYFIADPTAFDPFFKCSFLFLFFLSSFILCHRQTNRGHIVVQWCLETSAHWLSVLTSLYALNL